MPQVPTQLAAALRDRYVLEREIGRGGMAVVYLARDVRHERPVALKVLRAEFGSTAAAERFQREITTAARLQHPHILTVHDSGQTAGELWFVMPYVDGETLRSRLKREGALPVDTALRIARDAAQALEYAHGHGVVHRDIKPENLLLTRDGNTLVADFGIARGLETAADSSPALTGTGQVIGTPAYMSPEQAAGDSAIDARSDVYSLGCVLYEMLAGEPPFTGPTVQAVMTKRFIDAAPSVRRLRGAVPAGVDRALAKALARVPADRFSSARAFADALAAPATVEPRAPSVAVLPFINLSADPENEFFTDGITEDVIAQLSKVRSLKVISRTSVMPFKKREQGLREIGAALHVATVLEGSVRRVGDRVRIVAQLIDTEADQHVWAETYDRQITDIFAIQADVAVQIATALKAELTSGEHARIAQEPTRNLSAWQLYLQGRHWYDRYTEEGFRKGVEYFRQAIAADPGYALAHTAMAFAYAEYSAGQGWSPLSSEAVYAEAIAAVTRALALDPDLGEAHAVLGLLKCVHDFDWAGSEREFKIAIELNPGSADAYDHYAWLCSALGRHDEAVALARRAHELDPLMHRSDVATELLRAGRYEEAMAEALRAVDFEPDHTRARSTLGWAYVLMGRMDEGVAEVERAVALTPGNSLFLGQLGQAYALAGRRDDAYEVLRQLDELSRRSHVPPYHLAYVYTGLGEDDRAMDLLEQSYEERAGSVYGVKGSFLFRSLRGHPRFKALLRRMNLE
ncbi:MAG TPA: protein kinase [Gemmatimonadales bacterium]|nr:protein kinase [Gemmatimonadales bacterium]